MQAHIGRFTLGTLALATFLVAGACGSGGGGGGGTTDPGTTLPDVVADPGADSGATADIDASGTEDVVASADVDAATPVDADVAAPVDADVAAPSDAIDAAVGDTPDVPDAADASTDADADAGEDAKITCATAGLACVHGACDDSLGLAACRCEDLWTGLLCDACAEGHQDNDGDGTCGPTCATAALACVHGTCADSTGTAACECTGTWVGTLCDACGEGTQDNDGDGTCAASCAAVKLACVHGSCDDSTGTAGCKCADLWTGDLCDACAAGLQDNDGDGTCKADCATAQLECVRGTCDDTTGTAACKCNALWTGDLCDACEAGWQDNDNDGICMGTCAKANPGCFHGTCSDAGGTPICLCQDNWTGAVCSACMAGYQDNDLDGDCEPDCVAAGLACAHGTCVDTSGTAVCRCSDLWTGALCDACEAGLQDNDGDGTCTADCASADPACVHGACDDSDGTADCRCDGHWAGLLCDACAAGYQDNDGDKVCSATCATANLACVNGACVDAFGVAACVCESLWTGALCDACVEGYQDRDEDGVCAPDCATAGLACVHGACDDSSGTAGCRCDGRWAGVLCDACADGYQDNDGDSICTATCATEKPMCVNGACDDANGTAACKCKELWTGSLCDACVTGYQDNDGDSICTATCGTANPACVHGACSDAAGTAACLCTGLWAGSLCDACPAGYQDNDGDGTCAPTCATSGLTCVHGTCVDTSGTDRCECAPLWTGALCDACADGYQDNDGDGVCKPTCANVDLVCGPREACGDGLGTAHCVPAWPATCSQALDLSYGVVDGERSLFFANDPTKPWTAWCHGMATHAPVEYLTLPADAALNYSTYGVGGWRWGSLTTTFTKVRVDPVTLLVDRADFTFSTSTGVGVYSDGTLIITKMPYADAGDCVGSGANGIAGVDLTGTPFTIGSTFCAAGWNPTGWTEPAGGYGKTVVLHGGGSCGDMLPCGGGGLQLVVASCPGHRAGPTCGECAPEYVGGECNSCAPGYQDNNGDGTCSASCATAALECVHGSCLDYTGTPACQCTGRWTGALCDTCMTGYAGVDCASCADGYQDKNGDNICAPTCATAALGCVHGTCSDASGTPMCVCDGLWSGTQCSACVAGYQDNDGNGTCTPTCATAALTCVHGTCSDTSGTAMCVCADLWGGALCNACVAGYQDNDGNGTCAPTCDTAKPECVHGTCGDTTGTASCVCSDLWTGPLCNECVLGYQDNDGNGTCTPNCATAGLMCELFSLVCADAHGTAHCVSPYPATCQEVQDFTGPVDDGPQTLYFGHVSGKPWTAWCRGMKTVTPIEYLTLPAGSAKNYSTYMAYLFRNGNLTTSYSKVRIDPATLLVDRGDMTFATTVGAIYDCCSYPPVLLVGALPWADAQACSANIDPTPGTYGSASIDVTGTPFTVTSTFCLWGSYPKGYTEPASGYTKTLMMYGKGGCGGLTPCTGGLQLAYP